MNIIFLILYSLQKCILMKISGKAFNKTDVYFLYYNTCIQVWNRPVKIKNQLNSHEKKKKFSEKLKTRK